MYNCSYCNYESNYKYNTERHMQTQHKKESTPSAQHVLGTGKAQDNQTVSIQEYNNIVEETYKWKDAYEGKKQANIMKDNAVKIRDIQLLKLNNKLLSET